MKSNDNDIDYDINVRLNLNCDTEAVTLPKNRKAAVLKLITDNNKVSAAGMAKTISVTQRTVERHIRELRENGRLIRHGSAHGGYWEIVE